MTNHRNNRRKNGLADGNLTAEEILRRVQAVARRYIPGDDVDLTEELLQERRHEAALEAAQEYFCKLAPPERIISEELLQERREEAKRE